MLPKDPFMLMSYVNTQLRDNYESLDELCASLDASKDDIIAKLDKVGYIYSSELNKFVNK